MGVALGLPRSVQLSGAMTDVFSALADPTRRSIFERLVGGGPTTATEIGLEVGVSRQAVAKHLAILEAASLVEGTRSGRETNFVPVLDDLDHITAWTARMKSDWGGRMDVLKKIVDG